MIELTQNDFLRIKGLLYKKCGITLANDKLSFVQGRLHKRLRELGLDNYTDYYYYLNSAEGEKSEEKEFLRLLTTNKTDFFREINHFDFLRNEGINNIITNNRHKYVKIWSAASSSGEEAYSIAIMMRELQETILGLDFWIYATDINYEVLKLGELGIYDYSEIANLDKNLLKKYFLRGKGELNDKVRVTNELRKKVKFEKINLINRDYGVTERFDIVFVRNVLIYFDIKTQREVLKKIAFYLNRGGYLILGHTENAKGLEDIFERVNPTIYRKK